MTTGKRADRTKHDFRCPICRSTIDQASCLICARSGLTPEGLIPIVFWGVGEERWGGGRKNLSYPKQGNGVCICTGSIVLLSNMSTFAFYFRYGLNFFPQGCTCTGKCATNNCPCRRTSSGCSGDCGCKVTKCANRTQVQSKIIFPPKTKIPLWVSCHSHWEIIADKR